MRLACPLDGLYHTSNFYYCDVYNQHNQLAMYCTSIINHTLPSTIRAVIGTLVQVWPVIARVIVSAIRLYEYKYK